MHRDGQPQFLARVDAQPRELARRHPDDGHGNVLHQDAAAEHAAPGLQPVAPERPAHHRRRGGRIRAIVRRAEQPSQGRFHSEHREEMPIAAAASSSATQPRIAVGNFFPVLGVKPALGRLIGPQDDRMDAPAPVAVLSWAFWNSRLQLAAAARQDRGG